MSIRPCTEEEIKESAQRSKEKEQSQKDFIRAVKETFLNPEVLEQFRKLEKKD